MLAALTGPPYDLRSNLLFCIEFIDYLFDSSKAENEPWRDEFLKAIKCPVL